MIHVVDEDAIVEAEQVAGVVHAILLDSGNPTLETEELGGTGRRHDWAVSARIRERVDVPVFLAGGLNPDNASQAVEAVGPFALDACSGLRDPDFALDRDKLTRFAAAVGRSRAEETGHEEHVASGAVPARVVAAAQTFDLEAVGGVGRACGANLELGHVEGAPTRPGPVS